MSFSTLLYPLKMALFFTGLFLFFILAFTFNALQLLNYVLFARWRPALRRLVNNALQDVVLSSFLFLFEAHNSVLFALHFENSQTQSSFSDHAKLKNSLLIVNHAHQLDAFFYWQACHQLGVLGSIKAFTRAAYRWMPIVGWMLWFNESIFLQQNWRKDEKNIRKSLDRLRPYVDPYVLAFAPEGTRFTPERYCDSQAFIEEFCLPIKLKHHLLPRVKGFTTTLKHMLETQEAKGQNFSVYNVEFVAQIDENYFEPTLVNFLRGRPFKVDCYVAKVPERALPQLNAPNIEYTDFLYDLFEEKDRLVEEFMKKGQFTETEVLVRKQTTPGQMAKFALFAVGQSGGIVFCLTKLAIATQGVLAKMAALGAFALVCYTMKTTLKMVED